jgi:hypothetical protein
MLVKQIYPLNNKLRGEVPLWLKFRAFEYRGFAGRYADASGDSVLGVMPAPPNMLAEIYVPAPPMLTSGVNNKYNENPIKSIFDSFAGILNTLGDITKPKTNILGIPLNPASVGNKAITALSVGSSLLSNAVSGFYALGGYFFGIVPPDFNDNVYAGTNKRNFKFNLVLPCLTDEDSFAAFAIGRSFEALSVPATGTSRFVFKHPPMWGFGVGPGTGPFIDYTWLTDPQLCTLQAVAVNRSAPDGGSYTVFTKYGLKPSVTTIALSFSEIEPIYRQSGSLSMISRSQAFASIDNNPGLGLFQ